MNINKLYRLICGCLILLGACSKDVGNYDYRDVNSLEINGLLVGDHPTARIYEIVFRDTVQLKPIVTGTKSGNDERDLIFEWKVDSVIVSTTKDLFYIADKRYGRIIAEFSVVDKTTGLKTSYNCFLNVVNPYKWGYYVLTQNKEKEASILCLSSISNNNRWEKVILPFLGDLGQKPLSIGGMKKYGSSSSDFYNLLFIAIQDALNPIIVVDSREFLPILFYNSSSYVGEGNFVFRPSQVVLDPYFEILYVVNNGKFHVLQAGAIPLASFARDPSDYQVAANGIATPYGNGLFFMSVYDNKNKKIRVWDNGFSAVPYLYINDYMDIPGQELMDGKVFLAASYANMPLVNHIYLFRQGNQLFSYRLDYSSSYVPTSFSSQAIGVMPSDEEFGYVFFDGRVGNWYMTVGQTIFSASYLGLDFQKYIELPSSAKGVIVKFKAIDQKIMIATNDFSNSMPGSIYIYDANTFVLEQSYENVVNEIVDLHLGIL